MTPERLAIYRAKATEAPWGTDFRADMLNLLDHIRDLEAQVREGVQLATKLIEETNEWAASPIRFPESWGEAFIELNDWTDDADEFLATATPPSPEVGE